MQDTAGYIQQIPPGAMPTPGASPALRVLPGAGAAGRPAPPGVYVGVGSAADQTEAIAAALTASQRFGAASPGHVRGVVAYVEGVARILLFAGPFQDVAAADRFCTGVLRQGSCETRVFRASDRD